MHVDVVDSASPWSLSAAQMPMVDYCRDYFVQGKRGIHDRSRTEKQAAVFGGLIL